MALAIDVCVVGLRRALQRTSQVLIRAMALSTGQRDGNVPG